MPMLLLRPQRARDCGTGMQGSGKLDARIRQRVEDEYQIEELNVAATRAGGAR